MNLIFEAVILLSISTAQASKPVNRARAILFKSKSNDFPDVAVGVVDFNRESDGVKLIGSIDGLSTGLHALHINEKGDLSNGCLATGGRYKTFSRRNSSITHNGDLGNIWTTMSGRTEVEMRDANLTLNGPRSIIGRSLVIHEKTDDLGLGGAAASKNAGFIVACGVIGIADW